MNSCLSGPMAKAALGEDGADSSGQGVNLCVAEMQWSRAIAEVETPDSLLALRLFVCECVDPGDTLYGHQSLQSWIGTFR